MLFRRGCCLLTQCALWADVTVNINADQAVLPTLSTHRNELWGWGPGHLQEGECPEIEGPWIQVARPETVKALPLEAGFPQGPESAW